MSTRETCLEITRITDFDDAAQPVADGGDMYYISERAVAGIDTGPTDPSWDDPSSHSVEVLASMTAEDYQKRLERFTRTWKINSLLQSEETTSGQDTQEVDEPSLCQAALSAHFYYVRYGWLAELPPNTSFTCYPDKRDPLTAPENRDTSARLDFFRALAIL